MKRICLAGILGLLMLGFASTASAQSPIPGQPYRIPPQLAGYAPGSGVSYGGYSYVVQRDGTMLLRQPQGFTTYSGPPRYSTSYPPRRYFRGPALRRGPWFGPGLRRGPYWNY